MRSFDGCTSPGAPSTVGIRPDLLEQARAQQVDVDAGAIEQGTRAAALLVEERKHEVRGFDELVIAAHGERLRVRERELEFRCQPVHPHEGYPDCCLPR